jgi:hypothetical protein
LASQKHEVSILHIAQVKLLDGSWHQQTRFGKSLKKVPITPREGERRNGFYTLVDNLIARLGKRLAHILRYLLRLAGLAVIENHYFSHTDGKDTNFQSDMNIAEAGFIYVQI